MKRFTRKKEGKILAGVTTGIAAYFGVDPLIVRLVALFIFVITGFVPLIVVYCAAVIFSPYDEDDAA